MSMHEGYNIVWGESHDNTYHFRPEEEVAFFSALS
jgi:hypothetical protein